MLHNGSFSTHSEIFQGLFVLYGQRMQHLIKLIYEVISHVGIVVTVLW